MKSYGKLWKATDLGFQGVQVAVMVPAGGVRAAVAPMHRRWRGRPGQLHYHGAHDVVVVVQAAKAGQVQQRLFIEEDHVMRSSWAAEDC